MEHPLNKLSAPPRTLDPSFETFLSLGGFSVQLSLLIIIAGLGLAYIYFSSLIHEYFIFHNKSTEIIADVTKMQLVDTFRPPRTRYTHGSDRKTTYTYSITYTYDINGKKYSNVGYISKEYKIGTPQTTVPIDVVADNPEVSKLSPKAGHISYKFEEGRNFVVLVFFIAFFLLIYGIYQVIEGYKDISSVQNLVKNEKPIVSELINITTVKLGSSDYKMYFFRFTGENGKQITHEYMRKYLKSGIKIGDQVSLLYEGNMQKADVLCLICLTCRNSILQAILCR